jgi:hypothetical protein
MALRYKRSLLSGPGASIQPQLRYLPHLLRHPGKPRKPLKHTWRGHFYFIADRYTLQAAYDFVEMLCHEQRQWQDVPKTMQCVAFARRDPVQSRTRKAILVRVLRSGILRLTNLQSMPASYTNLRMTPETAAHSGEGERHFSR